LAHSIVTEGGVASYKEGTMGVGYPALFFFPDTGGVTMIMDYPVPTWLAWLAWFAMAALFGTFLSPLRHDRGAGAKASVRGTHKEVYRFLAADHARLDGLLRRAVADPVHIDRAAYDEFRARQLKHIAMEEKILLPATKRANDGEPLPIVAKLRRDHAAIAALLVPTPTPAIVATLRTILSDHNAIEEAAGGLYGACDEILAAEAHEILIRLRAAPDVRVNRHADTLSVLGAARRALERAGYDLKLEAA
jgi:hypothetical protein